MPIIRHEESPRFELPHLVVQGLASPRRGAAETCVWRLSLAPGADELTVLSNSRGDSGSECDPPHEATTVASANQTTTKSRIHQPPPPP